MKRMLKDWAVALTMGVVIFMGIQWLQPKPQIPDTAPDFTVKTVDGDSISLSDLRGRPVVINFWASWCGPCQQEVPAFNRFHAAHPEIPIIGLAVDSGNSSKVRKTAEQWGISYPVAVANNQLQRTYDISTLPTTIVVGPDGDVADIHVGMMSERQLARAIP
jgi:peroxiredoxin